jgi:hypothetical protein
MSECVCVCMLMLLCVGRDVLCTVTLPPGAMTPVTGLTV